MLHGHNMTQYGHDGMNMTLILKYSSVYWRVMLCSVCVCYHMTIPGMWNGLKCESKREHRMWNGPECDRKQECIMDFKHAYQMGTHCTEHETEMCILKHNSLHW